MDDTSYFQALEQYRTLSMNQLVVEVQALRCQLRTKGITFETRQLVFEPEYGAYMLPLLLPAARLSAAVLVSTRASFATLSS